MSAGDIQPAEVQILRRRADFLRAQAGRKAVREGDAKPAPKKRGKKAS